MASSLTEIVVAPFVALPEVVALVVRLTLLDRLVVPAAALLAEVRLAVVRLEVSVVAAIGNTAFALLVALARARLEGAAPPHPPRTGRSAAKPPTATDLAAIRTRVLNGASRQSGRGLALRC